jgi:hypothetical protein
VEDREVAENEKSREDQKAPNDYESAENQEVLEIMNRRKIKRWPNIKVKIGRWRKIRK